MFGTMHHLSAAVRLAAAPLFLMVAWARAWASAPAGPPVAKVIEERHFREYTVRISGTYRSTDPAAYQRIGRKCEVFRHDKLVFTFNQDSPVWMPGHNPDYPEECPLPLGSDVDGDGQPDLVLMEGEGNKWSPYAWIYRLGPTLKETAVFEGWCHPIVFRDLDGDRRPEILLTEYAEFPGYMMEYRVHSPAILKGVRGKWRPEGELMGRPRPTRAWFEGRVRHHRAASYKDPYDARDYYLNTSMGLWNDAMRLLFTGHEDLAWQMLHRCWRRQWPDETKEVLRFRKALAGETDWPALAGQYARRSRH